MYYYIILWVLYATGDVWCRVYKMCIRRSRVCERHAAARIVPAQTYIMYYIIVAHSYYWQTCAKWPYGVLLLYTWYYNMFHCWSANLMTQYTYCNNIIVVINVYCTIMMRCRRVDVRNSDVSFGKSLSSQRPYQNLFINT